MCRGLISYIVCTCVYRTPLLNEVTRKLLSLCTVWCNSDPTLCKEKGLVTIERFLGNAHHQQAVRIHSGAALYPHAYELLSNTFSVIFVTRLSPRVGGGVWGRPLVFWRYGLWPYAIPCLYIKPRRGKSTASSLRFMLSSEVRLHEWEFLHWS